MIQSLVELVQKENKEDSGSPGACLSDPLEIMGSLESKSLLMPLGFLESSEVFLGFLRSTRDPGVFEASLSLSRSPGYPVVLWRSWRFLIPHGVLEVI